MHDGGLYLSVVISKVLGIQERENLFANRRFGTLADDFSAAREPTLCKSNTNKTNSSEELKGTI